MGINVEEALDIVRESRLLINAVDEWLYCEFSPYIGNRILEVGCGVGNLTGHLIDRQFLMGIDISDESVKKVAEKFKKHTQFKAKTLSITDPGVHELKKHNFDTVISLNVLEHIQDDTFAIDNIYQVLQPGGKFVVIVPAHMALYGSMDRAIGHYRRYSKMTLREKLEEVDFRILCQKYINAFGAIGWFVNGRLFHRVVPPESQLKLLNRIVPVFQRMENVITVPFGVSLLTVAMKEK